MKVKNFRKRLILNKKTIVNLNNNEMKSIKGGVTDTFGECNTENCSEVESCGPASCDSYCWYTNVVLCLPSEPQQCTSACW
jgi:hypothetical protein